MLEKLSGVAFAALVILPGVLSGAAVAQNFPNHPMVMVVPLGCAASLTSFIRPPSTTIRVARSSSAVLVVNSTRATDAIEGNASPRKPSV